jgi:hypothetical protein|tara:strand:+ start:394 stop:849 length:456 start_codon:yes stop_codon:yes gene_type:complete
VSGNAYYIPGETGSGPKLPSGEYEATITSLEMTENVKCGGFIADIFKPVYRVANSEYQNTDVRDNGVFRYKEKAGYNFKPSRNWGFAKFCGILGLDREDGGKVTLPYLQFDMIDGFKVVIDVSYKNFVNESGNPVRYPVATLKKKLGEVPF